MTPDGPWSADDVAEAGQLACAFEASAEKPGNITPTHDFHDTSYEDMLRSAIALGPELAQAGRRGVGETVLGIVRASRRPDGPNTNLGIALLLAPIARAALGATLGAQPLRDRLRAVLDSLTRDDAGAAYAAIRLARPGGLAERVQHDVRAEPVLDLREAMGQAADRDRVASEYVTAHAVTFELGIPALRRGLDAGLRPRDAIVELHLELLAALPDTLIVRKLGAGIAAEVTAGAVTVLEAGGVRSPAGRRSLAAFDASLRDATNARNPGTTADLVAATLFVAVLEGML